MVYTFMSVAEINALLEMHQRSPGKREAQRMLAKLVTETVHGKDAAANAAAVSDVLFSGKSLSELTSGERATLTTEAPLLKISNAQLALGYTITEALIDSGLSSSKSDARRLVEGKGVSLNGETIDSADLLLTAAHFIDDLALLKRGKQVAVISIEK
jgi:tyrosyl-tRNA synthetase